MPSAASYLRPDVIAQVQRLDLRARFIVEGFMSGMHSSPYHGSSVEFSEHRKYVPGDDLRLIDWSLLARTDRYYIRKYEAETNMQCHLIVDTSVSMAYPEPAQLRGTGRMSKLDYAICLAAALGYLMVQQQDAVGLACFDTQLRNFLPARSKKSHLMRLLGELARVRPQRDEQEKGLAVAIHEVANRVHKRGLMIVLSDFLAPREPVIKALHHLRFHGHDVILFQVLDWSEVEFPFEQLTRFEDPETKRILTTNPLAIRESYLRALRDFTEEYKHDAAAVRSDFVQVHTAMTFDRALTEFLVNRRRRG